MYARDFALIATPIGMVRLLGTPEAIETITIERDMLAEVTGAGALAEGAAQIRAYFAGTLTRFDVPLAVSASPRGAAMRAAVVEIPFGATRSYGELARSIGSGARAIGRHVRAIRCRSSCRATASQTVMGRSAPIPRAKDRRPNAGCSNTNRGSGGFFDALTQMTCALADRSSG